MHSKNGHKRVNHSTSVISPNRLGSTTATSHLLKGIQQQCSMISQIQPIMREKRSSNYSKNYEGSQLLSPSEQSNQSKQNQVLNKETNQSTNTNAYTVLSSSSNMKTSYRGTEPLKLINEQAPNNQSSCLTAKEPISYTQSLKIDAQNKKSVGESTCIQDSICQSVTYYVDDPDTSSHCHFTETSGSVQMVKEENNSRQQEFHNFDEFDQQHQNTDASYMNSTDFAAININDMTNEGLKPKYSKIDYAQNVNPESITISETNYHQSSYRSQNGKNKNMRAPLSGGRLQQIITPVLQNNRSKNKYCEMPLKRQNSKQNKKGVSQTFQQNSQLSVSESQNLQQFDILSQSTNSAGRNTSMDKGTKTEKKANQFSFSKSKRGLLKIEDQQMIVQDLQKSIQSYQGRNSRQSIGSQSNQGDSYLPEQQRCDTRHSTSFMSCVSNTKSYSKNSKENSTKSLRSQSHSKKDVKSKSSVSQSHYNSGKDIRQVLVVNQNTVNMAERNSCDSVFVDDDESQSNSRLSSLRMSAIKSKGNEENIYDGHNTNTVKRQNIPDDNSNSQKSDILTNTQKIRISQVQDRISQQQKRLQEQERLIAEQQEQFEISKKQEQNKKKSIDNIETLGMNSLANSSTNLHNIVQMNESMNMKLLSSQTVTEKSHTKNNSLQTAQFLTEGVMETDELKQFIQDEMIVIPSILEQQRGSNKAKKFSKALNQKRSSIDSKVSIKEKNKCSIMDFNDYLTIKNKKSKQSQELSRNATIQYIAGNQGTLNRLKKSKSSSKSKYSSSGFNSRQFNSSSTNTRVFCSIKQSFNHSKNNSIAVQPERSESIKLQCKPQIPKQRVPRSERKKKPPVSKQSISLNVDKQVGAFNQQIERKVPQKMLVINKKEQPDKLFNTYFQDQSIEQVISPKQNDGMNMTQNSNMNQYDHHHMTDLTEPTIDQEVINNINVQNEEVDLNCSVLDNHHSTIDHQRFQMEFNQFQNDQDQQFYQHERDTHDQREIDYILQDKICDITSNDPLSYQRSPPDALNTIDQINQNSIDDVHRSNEIGKPPLKYNQRMLSMVKKSALYNQGFNQTGTFNNSQGSRSSFGIKKQNQSVNLSSSMEIRKTSQTNLKRSSSQTLKHKSCYDPNKSTIIQSHMDHKNKVTTLKHQFMTQKFHEKRILNQQNQYWKAQVANVKKATKQIQNENKKMFEHIKEGNKCVKSKNQKNVICCNLIQTVDKKNQNLKDDLKEIKHFKEGLKKELDTESQLIQDISYIALKYKKLIAEQRKEKEKLVQQVCNQRKVILNLKKKRDTYAEDQNKLFENFRSTISQDELKGVRMRKKAHVLRREDQDVLDC